MKIPDRMGTAELAVPIFMDRWPKYGFGRKQFPFFDAFTGAPYPYSGLNCSGSDCRANREQNNPSTRSTISGSPIHLADFHTVPLGYLIWHSQAPNIWNSIRLRRFNGISAEEL